MAEPQPKRTADAAAAAAAANDETVQLSASNETITPSNHQNSAIQAQRGAVAGVRHHQQRPSSTAATAAALLSNSFIENLPDLSELELEHSLHNVINIIPPPPPPRGLARVIPPPPPPPPAPTTTNTTTPGTSHQLRTTLNNNGSLPQLTEMHSDLMAAIRSAGGAERAGLRSIAQQDLRAISSSCNTQLLPKSNTCASDELMMELHRKLNLRRYSVSGRSDDVVSSCGVSSGGSGSVSSSSAGLVKRNVRKIESRSLEATTTSSSRSHINPIFSHLSTLLPQPTASSLHFDAEKNSTNSDNENDEDWLD